MDPALQPRGRARFTGVANGGSPGVAKKRQAKAPSRRSFLRTSMAGGFLLTIGGFGGATLAYLWPDLRGGFGAEIEAGDHDSLLEEIRNSGPVQINEARAYLVEYNADEDGADQYADLVGSGQIMALFWTCVHLGCKVPWCESSQWFECACHGSQYNRWGEYKGGPAPRGLDRFNTTVTDNGALMVDTSQVVTGPPRGSNQLGQARQGPRGGATPIGGAARPERTRRRELVADPLPAPGADGDLLGLAGRRGRRHPHDAARGGRARAGRRRGGGLSVPRRGPQAPRGGARPPGDAPRSQRRGAREERPGALHGLGGCPDAVLCRLLSRLLDL
ncbi:MAG: hypothetical protein BRC31_00110 [Actinobacteria bacterium QS_5_72_10]|nr:MAG: hypothetical protein BRC31_00110 [Actinobacteria bacterium QS_5_72_10]